MSEAEPKHTIQELHQWQALPLEVKVSMTKDRIRQWVKEYGEDGVCVSFSGGKDSTVLYDIVQQDYPNVTAVYCDTGLEYPEIRNFVKSYGDKVVWLKPKLTFKQVICKYGYPFISKEVSESVAGAKKYLTELNNQKFAPTDRQTDEFLTRSSIGKLPEQANTVRVGGVSEEELKEMPLRLARLMGKYDTAIALKKGNIPSKTDRSQFNCEKYKFFLDAPFAISNRCCNVMKKSLAHKYYHETSKHPITGQTASESRLRTQAWLKNGCNGFDMKEPISNPMAFWTEQDILLYIKQYGGDMVRRRIENLEKEYGCPLEDIIDSKTGKPKFDRTKMTPICSVYGDIVIDEPDDVISGQLSFADIVEWQNLGIFDNERPLLKTTGCNRTGCVMCGYGCHLEKQGETRWEITERVSNPALTDFCLRGGAFDKDGLWKPDNRGLGYWFCFEWMNKYGDLHIYYPHRDMYIEKYSTAETDKYLKEGD